MALDREWLLGVARAEREALGRTVQYTRPDAWDLATPWHGRPGHDVLAHLAATEGAAAALLAGESASEIDEYSKTTDDVTAEGFNDWSVSRRSDVPALSLAVEWGRAADLLLIRASKTTAEEWQEREIPWIAAELRLGYFIQSRVCQWWVHGQDILEGGGQPHRMEHPPTFCVNDLAVRLIPYALSLSDHSFPGLSMQVELEGVGGGRWHQGLEAGYVPPDGKKPDVYIEGRGHQFALLVTGRADPDLWLYEGLVNVGGRTDAADAVIHSLRAFP